MVTRLLCCRPWCQKLWCRDPDPRQGHHVLHHRRGRVPVCHQAATTPLGQNSVTQSERTGCHRRCDKTLSPGAVAEGGPTCPT